FPDKGFQFFFDGPRLSLGELWQRAERVAAGLQEKGVKPGDVVGALLPTGPDILPVLVGIFRSGAVLAPLAVPAGRSLDVYIERLRHIITDGDMRFIVTDPRIAMLMRAQADGVEVMTPDQLLECTGQIAEVSTEPDQLALVQYTSGSTANPRGVSISNSQLMAGIRAIAAGTQVCESDTLCSWLPLSHDMGLVSTLTIFGTGNPDTHHISDPGAFIKDPARWLRYFAEIGGTIYTGPNFSYQYMLKAFDGQSLDGLDLSRWRLALNGAEQIDAHLLESFVERFAQAGMAPTVPLPVYGMAEATLAVTFSDLEARAKVQWVDRELLADEMTVEQVDVDHPKARGIVSVGTPVVGVELRIVGTRTGPRPSTPEAWQVWTGDVVPEGTVGEIEIRGDPVTSGYFQNPEATEEAMDHGWLKTGDLGYLDGGELYITGRTKEMMIYKGQNYYPEDVEACVRTLPGLYRRRCIAFVHREDSGAENMAVAVETGEKDPAALEALAESIRIRVKEAIGIGGIEVYLLAPRSIRRTTSGKYQRLLMRDRIENGSLQSLLKASG
ncbi:MAG: AMP-binding protein, partial [Deltaproteobacteria bacterium]|nr:AMP-binding protein [Deltaproteobacteria bacterium]